MFVTTPCTSRLNMRLVCVKYLYTSGGKNHKKILTCTSSNADYNVDYHWPVFLGTLCCEQVYIYKAGYYLFLQYLFISCCLFLFNFISFLIPTSSCPFFQLISCLHIFSSLLFSSFVEVKMMGPWWAFPEVCSTMCVCVCRGNVIFQICVCVRSELFTQVSLRILSSTSLTPVSVATPLTALPALIISVLIAHDALLRPSLRTWPPASRPDPHTHTHVCKQTWMEKARVRGVGERPFFTSLSPFLLFLSLYLHFHLSLFVKLFPW